MPKKIAIRLILLLIGLTLSHLIVNANLTKPPIVFSTISLHNDSQLGLLSPEITVDRNGVWREASLHDLGVGQKFHFFVQNDFLAHTVGEVNVGKLTEPFAQVSTNTKIKENESFWGFYSTGQKIKFQGIGEVLKPEIISEAAQQELARPQVTEPAGVKMMLQKVIQSDWANILRDLPVGAQWVKNAEPALNIESFLTGDLNGDKNPDYVLIIGAGGFGNENSGPAAMVVYITSHTQYQRIPIDYWKTTDDYKGWPQLLFIKDLNDDRAAELFIAHSDSDTNVPIVYSWAGQGFIKVYEGKNELTPL
ncbi:MAG TPA: hypothetical protein VHY08_20065 [Bacillota bacterium]|nr:hypothetical protein [Bacillota bacterium]